MENVRLLIVEDEPEIREILRMSLGEVTSDIIEAKDGQEAMEKLTNEDVYAVLSDVNMPKKNGIELLRWLRSTGKQTPFVVLTAYGDKKMAVEALKLGAFDFLDKPWEEEQIMDVVARALRLGKEIKLVEKETQGSVSPEIVKALSQKLAKS